MAIFIFAAIIWTSGEILIVTDSGVFIAEQSPATHNGRLISLYEFSRGVGKCFGPMIFGYVVTYFSYTFVWMLIAGTCLAISLIIAILHKHE